MLNFSDDILLYTTTLIGLLNFEHALSSVSVQEIGQSMIEKTIKKACEI